MTIQEAIKTGKPFKRRTWVKNAWTVIFGDVFDYENKYHPSDAPDVFTVSDILAEDWEVKQ